MVWSIFHDVWWSIRAGLRTVFITLQQSGRLAAFDLATQTVKWNVPVGNTPAGVIMLPDDKRLLVALTGEDGIVVIDAKDGQQTGRLQTGKGAHNFWPKGDGRHWFLSNRVESTFEVSMATSNSSGRSERPGSASMRLTMSSRRLRVASGIA